MQCEALPRDLKVDLCRKVRGFVIGMGTGLTEEYALTLVRKWRDFGGVQKKRKIERVTINPLSVADLGFLSVVYNVILTFDDESEFQYIVKIPSSDRLNADVTTGAEQQAMEELLIIMHNRECLLYEILKDIDVPIPKLYACKEISHTDKAGYVVMESFIGRATVMGLTAQITAQQAFVLAKTLGKLQAEMEKVPKNLWADLNDTFRVEKDLVTPMVEPHSEMLIKYDPATFRPLIEKSKPFMNPQFTRYVKQIKAKELGVDSLVHSDLHGGNTMFQTNSDGSISNKLVTIFDWQSGAAGNSLCDLAGFTFMSVDPEVRRGCQQELMDTFYDTYVTNSKCPNPKFTKEVCQELYELAMIQAGLEWLMNFGFFATKPVGKNQAQSEAIVARMALRARFALEDSLKLMEKHDCHKIMKRLRE
ncbi:unnamed protein product [Bursaphelenchus okinawaensis]|uniref:CHK kinase-like domain-containing protein n=1 Tax=Bursaphelenchus okinawaensis TaxID=465554 RepID=A0A811K2B3_9BILA|nr:unnamed protein product [Bursaphelenchus okinawaensis]CAG9089716.1 unnamed protein product [Bursaphelenchus okinawaensis]